MPINGAQLLVAAVHAPTTVGRGGGRNVLSAGRLVRRGAFQEVLAAVATAAIVVRTSVGPTGGDSALLAKRNAKEIAYPCGTTAMTSTFQASPIASVRSNEMHCGRCGYSLRGLDERCTCPECGSLQRELPRRRRAWQVPLTITMMVMLICGVGSAIRWQSHLIAAMPSSLLVEVCDPHLGRSDEVTREVIGRLLRGGLCAKERCRLAFRSIASEDKHLHLRFGQAEDGAWIGHYWTGRISGIVERRVRLTVDNGSLSATASSSVVDWSSNLSGSRSFCGHIRVGMLEPQGTFTVTCEVFEGSVRVLWCCDEVSISDLNKSTPLLVPWRSGSEE